MLQEIESQPIESQSEAHPNAGPAKAAALTGALVQRGRDRAPRLPEVAVVETPAPALAAPAVDPVPLVFARPPRASAPSRRWSEALFIAACCAAFFATFLFVLRF